MTQEQKDLLLKDLCVRLPYGVKVEIKNVSKICTLEEIDCSWEEMSVAVRHENGEMNGYDFDLAKPYLFPMSSMTDKQKEELFFNYIHNDIYFDDFTDYFLAGELWHDICVSIDILPSLIDWFNKNKIDWRGLIPKGLALDATGLNIY